MAAFRAALEEHVREQVPLHWATTQTNVGRTLKTSADRTHDRAQLQEARQALQAAFAAFIEAGQEQHRPWFEEELQAIDQQLDNPAYHHARLASTDQDDY